MICTLHPHLCQFNDGSSVLAHVLALLRAFLAQHPVLFSAIVLPRTLRLVFDVESEPPRLLGSYEGEKEDLVFYVDDRGDSCDAPADCVSIVTYDVRASLGPRTAEFSDGDDRPRRPALGRERGTIIRDDDRIDQLYAATRPKPGCPGVRVDDDGREWYSARWIEARA